MIRKGICCVVVTLAVSSLLSAEEPARSQNPIKQRVPAKVLREAMNLPEYQQKTAESPPAPSMDDLQKLSDKLKKNGDTDGASLLQRFLNHHQRLIKQSQERAAASSEKLTVQVKSIEVNLQDLTKATELRQTHQGLWTREVETELHQLVLAGKAEILNGISFVTTLNETEHCHSGSEFLVPTTGDQKFEVREFGTDIEFQPTLVEKDRIRIQMTCENTCKDNANTVTILETTVPGITKHRMQCTFEMSLGESMANVIPASTQGRNIVLITKVTKKN